MQASRSFAPFFRVPRTRNRGAGEFRLEPDLVYDNDPLRHIDIFPAGLHEFQRAFNELNVGPGIRYSMCLEGVILPGHGPAPVYDLACHDVIAIVFKHFTDFQIRQEYKGVFA